MIALHDTQLTRIEMQGIYVSQLTRIVVWGLWVSSRLTRIVMQDFNASQQNKKQSFSQTIPNHEKKFMKLNKTPINPYTEWVRIKFQNYTKDKKTIPFGIVFRRKIQ